VFLPKSSFQYLVVFLSIGLQVVSPFPSFGLQVVPPFRSFGLQVVPPFRSFGLQVVPPFPSFGLRVVPPFLLQLVPPFSSFGLKWLGLGFLSFGGVHFFGFPAFTIRMNYLSVLLLIGTSTFLHRDLLQIILWLWFGLCHPRLVFVSEVVLVCVWLNVCEMPSEIDCPSVLSAGPHHPYATIFRGRKCSRLS